MAANGLRLIRSTFQSRLAAAKETHAVQSAFKSRLAAAPTGSRPCDRYRWRDANNRRIQSSNTTGSSSGFGSMAY
jgi:hypothetical protein